MTIHVYEELARAYAAVTFEAVRAHSAAQTTPPSQPVARHAPQDVHHCASCGRRTFIESTSWGRAPLRGERTVCSIDCALALIAQEAT